MTIAFLFVTLFALLLIGAPIAIALGLSSVATILLFSNDLLGLAGAQAVRDHAALHAARDPVLRPELSLPHHRRRGAADHPFRHGLRGTPARRFRHGRRARLHAVCRRFRFVAGNRRGDRLDRHRRHGQGGLLQGVRRRRHLQRRHARHPDSALDRHGGLRRRHQYLGRPPVHGGRDPRHHRRA